MPRLKKAVPVRNLVIRQFNLRYLVWGIVQEQIPPPHKKTVRGLYIRYSIPFHNSNNFTFRGGVIE